MKLLLRERLQRNSTLLYSKFINLESNAKRLLEYSQGGSHLTYTPHGLSHVAVVEKNYDWLLSVKDIDAFKDYELFILLSATYFHDVMMIPTALGDETAARTKHSERAKEFITKHHKELGLQLNEAVAIGMVILGHSVDSFKQIEQSIVIGSEKINIRKLAACLSISDICHADESRAPWIVKTHLELDAESEYHWNRHLQVSGITRDDKSLVMSVIVFSTDGEDAINIYKSMIETQLNVCAPYFNTVLSPINDVKLNITHLKSQLDQSFTFKSNMPEILNLLIDGVYSRKDVFIRELVQNCLDACLVRRARCFRANIQYDPTSIITLYCDNNKVKAIRVDDNGIGMSFRDVKNTLLWIGSSISRNSTVTSLVEEATGKQLIATFGIGMLSCFRVSDYIFVNTAKENEQPVEICINNISDTIIPQESKDETIGSSFYIEIDSNKYDVNISELNATLLYYFRDINQINLRQMILPYNKDAKHKNRKEIFEIANNEAITIEDIYDDIYDHIGVDVDEVIGLFEDDYINFRARFTDKLYEKKIFGEDYSGVFWLTDKAVFGEELDAKGKVEILNEGIFVQNDLTENWLPKYLSIFDARINISAKTLDLTASRDAIRLNEKSSKLKKELALKSSSIFEGLVKEQSLTRHNNTQLSLAIMYIYDHSNDQSEILLKKLDNYRVLLSGISNDTIELKDINDKVYILYPRGQYVKTLTTFDNSKLYNDGDVFAHLQALLLRQNGNMVIEALREDTTENVFLELSLITEYLKRKGIRSYDLVNENIIDRLFRSKKILSESRDIIGPKVKFVSVKGNSGKKVWVVDEYIWVNICNDMMKDVYDILNDPKSSHAKKIISKSIIESLSYQFDDSILSLYDLITKSNL